MKKLIIIKAGDTFADVMAKHGGFDKWIIDRMGVDASLVKVVDVENGEELPLSSECAGAIMTGSHSMVSEKLEWSEKTAGWIKEAVESGMPYFGICYGHQLLAHAMGGVADYNQKGMEIGTVTINKLSVSDPIFDKMPDMFQAHVIHSQSALELPKDSMRLCCNEHDANHAFRIGKHAWGVQFHPEFSAEVMAEYLGKYKEKLITDGRDYELMTSAVTTTPEAENLLAEFALYCMKI